jgi:hypothetical protein
MLSTAQAAVVVAAVAAYIGAGLLFALVFLSVGVQRIDDAARGASLGFRLLVLPGVTLLWPLLAWRWWRAASARGAGHKPVPGAAP